MARIPEREIERLKREISVERLAQGRGVELRRHGADLLGRCPFHDDHTPSLVITPAKNLWHCLGACGAGGGPIDWVMRAEGISFRHAVELLLRDAAPRAGGRREQARRLASPVAPSASDAEALAQVARFYHQTLLQAPEARAYLAKRGLECDELIARFELGFANRTLAYGLPANQWKAGAELRGRLQALGILRESGHEHFNGSLVVPIKNAAGEVVGMYGRKITHNLRPGTPDHLYLPGPHRGVWNEEVLAESREIILCEALLDAMTFWCAGFHNVTASYGVNGFTDDHRAAFEKHGVRKVYLAYDRDDAGDAAAQALAKELMARGIECLRVMFPRGMDANEYALKVKPAAKSLGVLVAHAEWLGGGGRPAASATDAGENKTLPRDKVALEEATPALAAPGPQEEGEREKEPEPVPLAETAAEPTPALTASAAASGLESTGEDEWTWRAGTRRWRARGLGRNTAPDALKANLLLDSPGGLHVDTLDLYAARHRQAFAKMAAEETGVEEDVLRRELGTLLRLLEDARARAAQPKIEAERPEMSEASRREAMELLTDPRLIERILADFEACGVVGEETNKLAAYLACTSRLLPRPLAVVVQSVTAAGKTALMDAALELMPEEQVARYSAMTGQALYYMGSASLKHKILAIAEEEGVARAGYALKLLQSEGVLRIAATGKDPESGRLTTHEYTVEGPAMIFLTTTAPDLDEELLNRCLALGVNEEREQTRAIHRRQRELETLDGLVGTAQRRDIAARHRNAQRLLEPIAVVNPHAPALDFPDAQTRSRRDHAKYLALIRAIALLHQHQRPRRQARQIEYIEATPEDVALANRIAREVLGRGMAELQPHTRRLLILLDAMVREGCEREGLRRPEYRFTRRQAREYAGWAQTRTQLHLRRLEELEYILAHRGKRGQGFVYELAFEVDEQAETCVLAGLKDVYDGNLSGSDGRLSPSNHPEIMPCQGGVASAPARMAAAHSSSLAAKEEKLAHLEPAKNRVVVAVQVAATGAGA